MGLLEHHKQSAKVQQSRVTACRTWKASVAAKSPWALVNLPAPQTVKQAAMSFQRLGRQVVYALPTAQQSNHSMPWAHQQAWETAAVGLSRHRSMRRQIHTSSPGNKSHPT